MLSVILDISKYKPSIHNIYMFLTRSVIHARGIFERKLYFTGIIIIEWIAILLYFVSPWNKRKVQLFVGFCISMLAISMPITGYLFNGFGETNNRWVYLVHFLFAVMCATSLTELKSITIASSWSSVTYTRTKLYPVIMFFTVANIVFNLFFSFSSVGANWKEEFIEADKVYVYTAFPKYCSLDTLSTDIYRVSNDSLTGVNGRPENVAMLNNCYGTTYWFSIVNQSTQEYVDADNEKTMKWRSFGFNNDIYTEALAGCKYYFSSELREDAEYIYVSDITFNDNTWYVYENPYYLGMAYTTDNSSSYDARSGMSLEEYNAWLYSFVSAEDISEIEYDNTKGIFSCNTNAEHDTDLVVALPYNQSWRAYIDGTEVDIEKSNMYMSVGIPSGNHSVEFKYSRNFNYFCVALCGVVFVGGVMFVKRRGII